MMITGSICRAARALVEVDRQVLAARSGVEASVIEAFERRLAEPSQDEIERLISALEELGAVFIPEDTRGAGVRLKFTRSERKRLQTLESEGGIVRSDDVP